jgi:methionine--tRNA ligase beta chain
MGRTAPGERTIRTMTTPPAPPIPPAPPASPTTSAAVPAPAPGAAGTVAPGSPKPTVTFEEFAKLDLRIARIVKAELHPKADKLLKLQLDDGSGVPRQICAGIREHYAPEQLEGRLIVIVANLAPRVIRGEESRGMLLAASDVPKEAAGEGAPRRVIILRPDADIAPGAIVS